jgi:hypothetical protein
LCGFVMEGSSFEWHVVLGMIDTHTCLLVTVLGMAERRWNDWIHVIIDVILIVA